LLAIVLGALFGVAPLATAKLDWRGIGAGALATVPMLLLFAALWASERESLRLIKERVNKAVRDLFPDASLAQLACVSAVAGAGEEIFFRGFLQGGLEHAFGRWPALAIGSLVFGLAHPVTRAYVALAALLGLYLGAVWIFTGNLLVPIVAHGLYDFVALATLARRRNADSIKQA
jgi:membrane protease YdiL (CAAX protease family)